MINITINEKKIAVTKGTKVIDAAKELGIDISRLCSMKSVDNGGKCKICVVEVEGEDKLLSSCKLEVKENMIIKTNSPRVENSIKKNLELISANHTFECSICSRLRNCELLELLNKHKLNDTYWKSTKTNNKKRVINESVAYVLDSGKCILCNRCVATCTKETGLSILEIKNSGNNSIVAPVVGQTMEDSGCIYCGKCIQACPVEAIKPKSHIQEVKDYLSDENIFTIVQAAPAIRVSLGEEFGMPIGTNVEGQMYTSFKKINFDEIADVNWGADLTIIEEGSEFIERLNTNGTFPMFTSCSPGWIRYIEKYRPDLFDHLSSSKSPHQMSGAMAKHYWSKKLGVDKNTIKVISIMPCIAKKYEAARPELQYDGLNDVDIVLTVREYATLLKEKKINFPKLPITEPTGELAKYTGAGAIFGATGGVMEAALRTVVELLENKPLEKIKFEEVRGMDNIREATLKINNMDINVAVVHGGKAIGDMFKLIDKNVKQYHFIEFMGCSGGCINGGGQPVLTAKTNEEIDIRVLRANALYKKDDSMILRKSHENKEVMKIYDEFFTKPGDKLAHDILHTHFIKKS